MLGEKLLLIIIKQGKYFLKLLSSFRPTTIALKKISVRGKVKIFFSTDVWFMVLKRSVFKIQKQRTKNCNDPTYGYGAIHENVTKLRNCGNYFQEDDLSMSILIPVQVLVQNQVQVPFQFSIQYWSIIAIFKFPNQ